MQHGTGQPPFKNPGLSALGASHRGGRWQFRRKPPLPDLHHIQQRFYPGAIPHLSILAGSVGTRVRGGQGGTCGIWIWRMVCGDAHAVTAPGGLTGRLWCPVGRTSHQGISGGLVKGGDGYGPLLPPSFRGGPGTQAETARNTGRTNIRQGEIAYAD